MSVPVSRLSLTDAGPNVSQISSAGGPLPRGRSGRLFWTTPEIQIIREHYPTGGAVAVEKLLPHRSRHTISMTAAKHGVRHQATHRVVTRWSWTPHHDELIRIAYLSPTPGFLRELSRRLGRPDSSIKARARRLGYVTARLKEPEWTEDEVELLAAHAHLSVDQIQRRLKRAGFARTPYAITVKRKRLSLSITDPNHYTGNQLAGLFGVDPRQMKRSWIESGLLKVKRRGTKRGESQGGDHYWIHWRAVRQFVIDNVGIIDFRKLDRFFLVELLTRAR